MSIENQELTSISRFVREKIVCSAAIRLYQARNNARDWNQPKLCALILCVNDATSQSSLKALLFNSWNEAWKCSLDSTSIYEKDCSFFHSIADDSIMNGFNFADEREADLFFFNIQLAISQRGIKSTSSSRNAPQLPRRPPSNENNMPSVPPTRYEQPQTIKENSAQESRSSRVPPPMRPESSFESNPSTVISAMKSSSSEKRNEELESKKDNSIQGIFGFGKKKKEKKINKVLISNPSNFQHLSHVGYNPESGFDATNIPAEWRAIFAKAGISDLELSDKKNVKVINKFMATHGDPNAPSKPVRSKAPPPPPNSSNINGFQIINMKGNVSSTMNSRPQPPPPPPQSNRSQLVAPSVPGRATPMVPPPRQNRSNDIAVAPRIPDRNEGYAINTPPPPPPPQFSSNRPNQPHNPSISNAPQGNVRVDLMAAIQGGHQLKERTPKPQPKEEEEEIEEPEDLAAAIRAALDARKGALMDSDDEDEEDEDEW